MVCVCIAKLETCLIGQPAAIEITPKSEVVNAKSTVLVAPASWWPQPPGAEVWLNILGS